MNAGPVFGVIRDWLNAHTLEQMLMSSQLQYHTSHHSTIPATSVTSRLAFSHSKHTAVSAIPCCLLNWMLILHSLQNQLSQRRPHDYTPTAHYSAYTEHLSVSSTWVLMSRLTTVRMPICLHVNICLLLRLLLLLISLKHGWPMHHWSGKRSIKIGRGQNWNFEQFKFWPCSVTGSGRLQIQKCHCCCKTLTKVWSNALWTEPLILGLRAFSSVFMPCASQLLTNHWMGKGK